MRFLWVEDEFSRELLLSLFSDYFYEGEIDKYKNNSELIDYLRNEKKFVTIDCRASFIDAYKNIFESNEEYDLIILDVKFPIGNIEQNVVFYKKEIEPIINQDKNMFYNLFKNDDYRGFYLYNFVIKYYKDLFKWTLDNIKQNIFFFTGNDITPKKFEENLKKINEKTDFDSDAFKIAQNNFFRKENISNMQNIIKKKDPCIDILDTFPALNDGSNLSDSFRFLFSLEQSFKDKLTNIRQILENILDKSCEKINKKYNSNMRVPTINKSQFIKEILKLPNTDFFLRDLENNPDFTNANDEIISIYFPFLKKYMGGNFNEFDDCDRNEILNKLNEIINNFEYFVSIFNNEKKLPNFGDNEERDLYFEDQKNKKIEFNNQYKSPNGKKYVNRRTIVGLLKIKEEPVLNTYAENLYYFINKICSSTFGTHIKSSGNIIDKYKLENLVNTAIYGLKYFILWYGDLNNDE